MKEELVGKFIKNLRKSNNLTQAEFASKYGVTYQAVSKWENGKAIPDISILKQISEDFNVSLDDILEGEYSKKRFNKKIIIIFIICVLVLLGVVLIIRYFNNNNFEFKTLSTSCDNFTISGNISYNNQKSAIYITNINYCGGNDDNEYDEIECILYEVDDNKNIEISSYKYDKDEKITLEEFLKNVVFVVDNYNSVCKKYSEDSLNLVIKAKLDDKTINYDIPIFLDDECD